MADDDYSDKFDYDGWAKRGLGPSVREKHKTIMENAAQRELERRLAPNKRTLDTYQKLIDELGGVLEPKTNGRRIQWRGLDLYRLPGDTNAPWWQKTRKRQAELKGFSFEGPLVPTKPQERASEWFSSFAATPATPTLENVSKWQQDARAAADRYIRAQQNRAKLPAAERAKKDQTNSSKERDAELRAQGKPNKEIADELGLSVRQVQRIRRG